MFGEMALLDGLFRSATATATEQTELIKITREQVETKLDKASDAIYRKKHNDRIRRHRYSEGLWKPSQGSEARNDGDLHLGLILYPGQGFPYWW